MSSDKKENVGTADFMHLTVCQAAGPLRFELTQPSCQLPRKSQSEALQKCLDFPIGNQPTMGRKWVRAELQLNWCTCVAAAVLSELDGSLTLKEKKKTLFCFDFTIEMTGSSTVNKYSICWHIQRKYIIFVSFGSFKSYLPWNTETIRHSFA